MKNIFHSLASGIATELKDRVQASVKDVAMLLAATLLLVCGFVVLMFAGYVFLLRFMEPAYAALIIAGLFVLAALVLLLAIKTRAAHPDHDDGVDDHAPAGSFGDLEARAMDYVRHNAKQASVASLLAGVVVGSSPEIRRTLMRALDAALAERQGRPEQPPPGERR